MRISSYIFTWVTSTESIPQSLAHIEPGQNCAGIVIYIKNLKYLEWGR